jgi:hypothetical protein
MIKNDTAIKATKSARSADAKSFILSAVEVMRTEYGCNAEIIGDISLLKNLTVSSEYFNQLISVLATAARTEKDAKITFETNGKELSIRLITPLSSYTNVFKSSYISSSSADLGDFTYSVETEGDYIHTVIGVKLKATAAVALYAISPNDLKSLIKELIDSKKGSTGWL